MDIYGDHGVQWLWIVDPLLRLLEVFTLEGEHWSRVHSYSGSDLVRADPFPAAEIDLASIWGPDEVTGE